MAIIINELEVITEPPRPPFDAGGSNAEMAQRQAASQMNPEVIRAIWRRAMERAARVYAG